MNIGILGGSFNPIHNAHLHIAEKARESFNLKKIIFIPNYKSPHKIKVKPNPIIRYNMIKLAIKTNKYFQVSKIELINKKINYTIDTVKILKQIYPNSKLYLIIGEDLIDKLHTWKNYQKLIKEINFISTNRGYQETKTKKAFIKEFKSTKNQISSSEIRNYIKKKKSIKYLIPKEVENYIKKNNLYS